MKLLSEQTTQVQCKIDRINLPTSKKIKLLRFGIHQGTKAKILRNRGGDIVLSIGNARVGVGRTIANFVEVTVL